MKESISLADAPDGFAEESAVPSHQRNLSFQNPTLWFWAKSIIIASALFSLIYFAYVQIM